VGKTERIVEQSPSRNGRRSWYLLESSDGKPWWFAAARPCQYPDLVDVQPDPFELAAALASLAAWAAAHGWTIEQ
jgi:hypothetical protein